MANQESGKGQPTPKRAEAEAKRKQQLKIPADKKAAKAALRERQTQANIRRRIAMYTWNDSELPARDQGKVKAFVRDWVDSRLTMGEIFVPFAFFILIVLFIPSVQIQLIATYMWMVMFVLLLGDSLFLWWRLRKALTVAFPDGGTRGAVSYGLMRSLAMRASRLPKPRKKIGGAPKDVKIPASLQN
jgi:hypothetical protein